MSLIDLKHTTISIKDGYTGPPGPGLVNNAGGYTIAATTMAVDGLVGAVAVGDIFTMVGADNTVYTITAHTETTGNTTSITFTPGLTVTVIDDQGIIFAAHEIQLKIGEGTLSFDEHRKMQYILDRGLISEVREGDQEPMDVRFDFMWEFLRAVSASGVPTMEDALKKRGEAVNWVSSDPDTCRPYSVDIVILYTPVCEDVEPELIILEQFRYESLNHDAKAGTIAVTGKCNVLQSVSTRIGD